MKKLASIALVMAVCSAPLWAKKPKAADAQPALTITSRAVLVDVMVTGKDGKPVTGLSKDAFTVTDQGKPQAITFFEENGAHPVQAAEMPKLPPDVFSNFSPFPQPPAVNVILLDSLNTKMEDQSFVHTQAMNFLNSAKPGTRAAIFTMGLGLHFIQGFNDDPAVLAAALNNKKNIEVEKSAMLMSQEEQNLQASVPSMAQFFKEMNQSQAVDRQLRTLANLQQLAAFLQGFPGRKNIIWFTEKVPGGFVVENGDLISQPVVDDQLRKTFAMLGAARAAIYPVDARGTSNYSAYTAENNPKSEGVGAQMNREDNERNSDQMNAQVVAEESGGRAFANMNGLSDILGKVTADSSHFYTLSYTPTHAKMDGTWRKIGVKVAGGNYHLSYRRGYFAVDTDSSAGSSNAEVKKAKNGAEEHPAPVDPLLPFMELGMPQSEQIVYQARVTPQPPGPAASSKEALRYAVDLVVDLKDLDLQPDSDGIHHGLLNFTLLVFDRYGNVINHQEHAAGLTIKPDSYAAFQKDGVHLHADVSTPKGNYWLRTGIYDATSHKVGTLEVPLAAVKPVETAVATVPRTSPLQTAPRPPEKRIRTDKGPTELVTVHELEQLVGQLRGKSDKEAVQRLSHCKLTERLTTACLEALQASLPDERSRSALLAVADVSAFLPLPAADLAPGPAPDVATQRAILSRAIDFIVTVTARMPDFLAQERTLRFQDTKFGIAANDPVIASPNVFHQVDSQVVTVRYRNGHEDQAEPASVHRTENAGAPPMGIGTWGLFGPMLQTVMRDILKGKIGWARWEQSPSGPVAVFRYEVPKAVATYTLRWCCVHVGPGIFHDLQDVPQYRGEIAIQPASGAVTRLVVIAQPDAALPVSIADSFVEYGPVEIGGRTYICPIRSATLLVAQSPIEHGTYSMGSQVQYHEGEEKLNVTSISDSLFDSYHVFRSEMKIVER